jgi:peptide-methionine (S)-S-oxide reductase
MQKCTLALGCFWKPEENFKSKPGVLKTEVGYAGGSSAKQPMKKYAQEALDMLKL